MTPACSTKSALAPSTSVSTFNSVPNRRTSCGTVCSSNSSCLLQKRKPVNPLQASVRTFVPRTPSNSVKQRVLSAKLIKIRSIQSQLNDANFHLTVMELSRENRALKTLQNRQDKALRNYEGTNADLPRLIKSHEEEMRVLQEKNKTLRKLTKDLSEQIKIKDEEMNNLSDQLKHLMVLSKDKHLEEREKLSEKLEEVTQRLKEHEQLVTVLNRKLILETKNCRFKLNAEVNKHKLCQRELGQALMEIGRLNGTLEGKNKSSNDLTSQTQLNHRKRQLNHIGQHLNQTALPTTMTSQSTSDLSTAAVVRNHPVATGTTTGGSEISLVPIKSAMKPIEAEQQPMVMASPAANIRARLSAGSENVKEEEHVDGDKNGKSRPGSVKLEQLLMNKTGEVENTSSNKLPDALNSHKSDYKFIQSSTNSILQSLKDADKLDQKLRKGSRFTATGITKKDRDKVNQLWQSEYSGLKPKENDKNDTPLEIAKRLAKYDFSGILSDAAEDLDADLKFNAPVARSKVEPQIGTMFEGTFDRAKTLVTSDEKTKLLATLRAIDNGESIDTVVGRNRIFNSGDTVDKLDIRTHTSDNLMKELFGDT